MRMKRQIKEIAKKAGAYISTHNLASNPVQYRESVELWDDRIEKFAFLIIDECIAAAEKSGADLIYTADKAGYVGAGQALAIKGIKEHFKIGEP